MTRRRRFAPLTLCLLAVAPLVGCTAPQAGVAAPRYATVVTGGTLQLHLAAGAVADAWSVDGILGGSADVGTVTAAGLYTAPAQPGPHTLAALRGGSPVAGSAVHIDVVAPSAAPPTTGIFTYRGDGARSGIYAAETALSPTTVDADHFGKLAALPVDGSVYAQPLYIKGVPMRQASRLVARDVILAATTHGSVYAFDAGTLAQTPLWQRNLVAEVAGAAPIQQGDTNCMDYPEEGITGTPVYDPASGTLYAVAASREADGFHARLHALDVRTGVERPGSPVEVKGTVITPSGATVFDALLGNQRAGLALAGGTVYVAYASHCDLGAFHGWVLGFDAATLALTQLFTPEPTGSDGGIWMSGGAPAIDPATSDLFLSVGNGDYEPDAQNLGDSVLRLRPGAAGRPAPMQVVDSYTPADEKDDNANDLDVGSGGVLLLPDQPGPHPHLLVTAGKDAVIYLLDRDQLGGYDGSGSAAVQAIPGAITGLFSTPAYFANRVYLVNASADDVGGPLAAFSLLGGQLSTTPVDASDIAMAHESSSPVISSNGNQGGIVWMLDRQVPVVLRAFDANDLETELYDSLVYADRDSTTVPVHFGVPIVAGGRVIFGAEGQVYVFGLLPSPGT